MLGAREELQKIIIADRVTPKHVLIRLFDFGNGSHELHAFNIDDVKFTDSRLQGEITRGGEHIKRLVLY
jgi:hypothetical protein